jgi:antitoxin ParD1/3/4
MIRFLSFSTSYTPLFLGCAEVRSTSYPVAILGAVIVFNAIQSYFSRKIMQLAEKLSITLPAEMARVIREKVGAGVYSSNSEVIREAVRQWMERNQQLALLDASISKGLSDAQSERTQSIEAVREQLHQRFES